MARDRGFTLIEILTVIMILMLLAGMLLPMIGYARKSGAVTSTRALLKRVSMGIENFRSDVGTYPYQDQAAGASFPEPNRLAWHLAHDMTSSERTELRTDAAMAAGRYDSSSQHGTMVIKRDHIDQREANIEFALQDAVAGQLNRMASTRARVAIYAGATGVTGIKAWGGYDHSAQPLVPQPTSRGFARAYLGDDISPKEIKGDAIVDRWGQPLVYICPVLPGVRGCRVPESMGLSRGDGHQWITHMTAPIDEAAYGLHHRGREVTDSLASDARTSAAEAWAKKPEIWSSGPDRRCAPERNDRSNGDNIAIEAYTRDLR